MRITSLFAFGAALCVFLVLNGCSALKEMRSNSNESSVDSTPELRVDSAKKPGAMPDVLRQTVLEIVEYQNYIADPSGKNLMEEIKKVAGYDLKKIGLKEHLHIVLLSLHPKVSSGDIQMLKLRLDAIRIDAQGAKGVQGLAEILLEISKRHSMLRIQKDLLSEELDVNLKKIIVRDQGAMALRKRAENLEKQLQGLRDIERIILKREKSDVPVQ